MTKNNIRYKLIYIWLFGFILCGIMLAYSIIQHSLEMEQIIQISEEIISTFAPPLTIMLTFIFSNSINTKDSGKTQNILAVLLSLLYISVFCFLIILFVFFDDIIYREDLVELFGYGRTFSSFLVAGLITYYFASTKKKMEVLN